MPKIFNVATVCLPDIHYMVDISDRLCAIKKMVDQGDYFTINRARQYGKTTTMYALSDFLKAEYTVIYLDFLAQLRGNYIRRRIKPAFQSVILAGVYDIKNLKRKFVSDGQHSTNSPWNTHADNEENENSFSFDDCPWDYMEQAPYNIAADYLVEMSFSPGDIAGMLREYENDYQTGMDVTAIAEQIFEYTSGYPFLVSRICKLMDEQIVGAKDFTDKSSVWTAEGVTEAVSRILNEKIHYLNLCRTRWMLIQIFGRCCMPC
ncbi:MAG: hypothetical protein LUE14_12800 [Clostridiales bacterium]|nr:hypothetical protein [Clostridiales bacterium]